MIQHPLPLNTSSYLPARAMVRSNTMEFAEGKAEFIFAEYRKRLLQYLSERRLTS